MSSTRDLLDALRRAEVAEAKLALIQRSCDIADEAALAPPGVLSTALVRVILDGKNA